MLSSLSRLSRTVLFNALRFIFRLAPLPQSTRDRLRQRFLDKYAGLVPSGPRGHVDSTKPVRRPYARADEKAIGYVPYSKDELPDPLPATLIAFYLPQFHSIPENDEWWGKGFTEWRNVTRALPQFEGHAQPRLPGDLGFYDLRDPEVMRKQATLAREYGVSAFCFYFYWFGGKTLLETPLLNWLEDPTLDLSFCLCWANEKWSRRWDGRGDDILMDQQHSPEDDLAFISYVADYLRDPRYLRVEGKPILLLYRPGLLPDAAATARRWREWCLDNGVGEIHLTYVQSFDNSNPAAFGFDAAVEFPPNLVNSPSVISRQRLINPNYSGQILDWRAMADAMQKRSAADYPLYRGVNPGWDNEPRRPGEGRTFLHSSPRAYGKWLQHCIGARAESGSRNLIFINAWNEWAEGAVLEPDSRLGYAYLEETRRAMWRTTGLASPPVQTLPTAVIHAWYLEEFRELLDAIVATDINWRLIVTTSVMHAETIKLHLAASRFAFELVITENRGRDILPFLRVAGKLLDEGTQIVLKLHTKRTTHRTDGGVWRRELVERLLGGTRGREIFDAFLRQPDLGMVGAEGHIQLLAPYLGANSENLDYLSAKMGVPVLDPDADLFMPGSMFWIRLDALRPILDANLEEWEFEQEAGQIDGTTAHALERMFCMSTRAVDLRVASAADLIGIAEPSSASYPYARRS
ncbi:glycoside hydrolase family 99-like domain-containing protein [Pseudoxanthomonas sacheonensis]|uniref:Lipopolysaccharide biosynthesis protein n=1 Tax=Pseudoxanthomonas sacheonensis TaxID=443615 RepID=A0ABU1RWQ2_9GAMM|nr:glycoside hydrolase family 99-like domain-containing protein [Pseudoxanthomonas sacheonensis]MDR6843201.1 lipopolysaccharide biosynthesis protein [Pseudoxanthomonas sacheonensis]